VSDDKTRDAIDRTAVRVREAAQKNGVSMTHTEARDRVEAARESGDRKRENGNR
jgi:hypothetical protein